MLISKVYSSREEKEAHQEKELAELNAHHNLVVANNIKEGMRIQDFNKNCKLEQHAPIEENVFPIVKAQFPFLSQTKSVLAPIPAPISCPFDVPPSAQPKKKQKLRLETGDMREKQGEKEENKRTENLEGLAQESSVQPEKIWKSRLRLKTGDSMREKQCKQEENKRTESSEGLSQESCRQPRRKSHLEADANTRKMQWVQEENERTEAESSKGLAQDIENSPIAPTELELIFNHHPDDLDADAGLLQTRYIKTSTNATGEQEENERTESSEGLTQESAKPKKKWKLRLETDDNMGEKQCKQEIKRTKSSQGLVQESPAQKRKWKLHLETGERTKSSEKQCKQEANERIESSEGLADNSSAQPKKKWKLRLRLKTGDNMSEKQCKQEENKRTESSEGLSQECKRKSHSEADATMGEMQWMQEENERIEAENSERLSQDIENSSTALNEIELIFNLHPDDLDADTGLLQTRYIKTSTNATVDHLSKYLATRTTLDRKLDDSTAKLLTDSPAFSIFIATGRGQFHLLKGSSTLGEVNEKYWKVNKPLEMYFGLKKP